MIRIVFNDYRELYTVFLGFISGFIGWFEQMPFFVLIPVLLMLLLVKTKYSTRWFLAYVISVCMAYLGNYLWMFLRNTHDKILFSDKNIDLIYFIVPSLLVSMLCNWLLFKRQYARLKI